jgi:hypothetical protein
MIDHTTYYQRALSQRQKRPYSARFGDDSDPLTSVLSAATNLLGGPAAVAQTMQTAAQIAQTATPQALNAARAVLPASLTPAFDTGVAIASGAAAQINAAAGSPIAAPAATPMAQAGLLATLGLPGAPAETAKGVLSVLSKNPAAVQGAKQAAAALQAVAPMNAAKASLPGLLPGLEGIHEKVSLVRDLAWVAGIGVVGFGIWELAKK